MLPPEKTDDRDPLLAEPRAHELGHGNPVAHEPLDRERAGGRVAVLALRGAGAGLIPLHDREVPLPARVERRERAVSETRAAEKQHDGVRRVRAADRDPLVDAVDVDEQPFIDSRPGVDNGPRVDCKPRVHSRPGVACKPGVDRKRVRARVLIHRDVLVVGEHRK